MGVFYGEFGGVFFQFREVTTSLLRPFTGAEENLSSFESSRRIELIPGDEKMLIAADPNKDLVVPRPLPIGFASLYDTLEFTVTDLMAGPPFMMDDERLCNQGCKHPLPPAVKAFTTVATVHTGRAKRSARKKSERKNGLSSKWSHGSSKTQCFNWKVFFGHLFLKISHWRIVWMNDFNPNFPSFIRLGFSEKKNWFYSGVLLASSLWRFEWMWKEFEISFFCFSRFVGVILRGLQSHGWELL